MEDAVATFSAAGAAVEELPPLASGEGVPAEVDQAGWVGDGVVTDEPLMGAGAAEELSSDLQDLARPGPAYDPEELAETVRSRTVLVVRQTGIAVGTLVAVGLSVLFNGLVVGLLVLAFLNSPYLPEALHLGDVKTGQEADGGGGGVVMQVLGSPGEVKGAEVANVVGEFQKSAAELTKGVALPTLASLPPAVQNVGTLLPGQGESAGQDVPLIGVPVDGLAAPRIKVKLPARVAPPVEAGPTIVGPAESPKNTVTATVSVNAAPAIATKKVGGAAGGSNDSDDIDPGDIVQLRKGNGNGSGEGNGEGEGIDRGASGANNERPGILSVPEPQVSFASQLRGINGRVVLRVTVLADGTPGEIKIVKSCGDAEVDAACRAAVSKSRFRAAYRNGRNFAATVDMSFSFGKADG